MWKNNEIHFSTYSYVNVTTNVIYQQIPTNTKIENKEKKDITNRKGFYLIFAQLG